MIVRRRAQKNEWVRNFFLIILAVGVVVVFFNLDIIRHGESVFSKSADKKLKFRGELKRDNYTKKELARLLRYTKKYNDIFEKVSIRTSSQDSYKKIISSTEILFEVQITMTNGFSLSTPVRRTQRKNLVGAIITKLNKDMRAYKDLQKKGKKIKALVNTM